MFPKKSTVPSLFAPFCRRARPSNGASLEGLWLPLLLLLLFRLGSLGGKDSIVIVKCKNLNDKKSHLG